MKVGHIDETQNQLQPMARTHLVLRNGRFYFRRRVPDELREILGKKELKISLGTADRKKAEMLASIESMKSDRLFDEVRLRVQQVASLKKRQAIGYSETILLLAKWYQDLEELDEQSIEENSHRLSDREETRDARETALLQEYAYSGGGKPENGRRDLENILKKNDCIFEGEESEYTRLAGIVRKGFIHNAQNFLRRLENDNVHAFQICPTYITGNPESTIVFNSGPKLQKQQPPYNATVEEVLKVFLEERTLQKRSGATLRSYKVVMRLLREVLGEKTIMESISRDQMKEVWQLAAALPSNATKKYRGKSLKECAKLAAIDGSASIKENTLRNYLVTIHSIFNFALDSEKISKIPIKSSFFKPPGKKITQKKLFQIEELNLLFSSGHYKDRGAVSSIPGRFWVPLIGLFHGMRSNEICQLNHEDVFEKDGIWCLNLSAQKMDGSASEKRLKNEMSRRLIPVHPTLLKLGFDRFVKMRSKDLLQEKMFTDLKLGKTGNYSNSFQKWFGRFIEEALGYRNGTSMHSMRHMWKDKLSGAGASDSICKQLGGWSKGTSAFEAYGEGASLQDLLKSQSKIKYDGLILDHLFL